MTATEQTTGQRPPSRTHTRPGALFAVLSVGLCSYSFLQSVSIPTLSVITEELDTDLQRSTWLLTAFLLSSSVATPVMGRLGDAFGKRRMLVASLLLLLVGSLAAAAAPTIELMIAARVLQGIGGGTIPLTFAILRDELPSHRVAGALAMSSSLLAFGFAAGTVAAGPIASGLGIRWLFLFPALVAGAAALLIWLLVQESEGRTGARVPLGPALLLAGWLVSLLLAISRGPQWGWGSAETLGLLTCAGVLFALWTTVEWRIEVPLIDLRLMGLRGVWSANLVALMTGMASFGALTFMPQMNQTPSANGYGFGVSATEAGHMMLPSLVATFLCGMVAARVMRRIGIRLTMMGGAILTCAGMLLVVFLHDEKWQMYLANGVAGLGTGLTFACLANAIIAAVPREHTGVATGMNANIRTIGGSIGVALATMIITANPSPSGYPAESSYITGFAFLAGVAVLATLAAALVPTTRRVARRVAPVEPV
ncbi:MFS transporter [Nocardioides sp. cx-169]|uniref:MFS transporter n=1 Tax=Nocardioides sp. cx-169 TaxID=2899080 RepID=UPI001E2E6842|nr:MFS transporter [Nocardioides sp. cx-169]MCD4533013.1 MFS transporter [Nocardioides sp. cx-169]